MLDAIPMIDAARVLDTLKSAARLLESRDPDEVCEPDPELLELAVPIIKALKAYFRAEVHNLEKMPRGKALVVGNHNAGITFFEPFVLGMEWHLHTKGTDIIHPLGHDIMVSLPLVGSMLKQLGVIRAAHHTANAALEAGHKVLVFPGGNYEAFRPYKERYKVDFGGHHGYIKLALRNKVPIVPVLSIGGHETFFVLRRGEALARLTGTKRFLRSESFPIFLGLPWGIGFGPIFHLPLPAKCEIEVGDPIDFSDYGPEDAQDRDIAAKLSAIVEDRLQEMMDRRAARRRLPVIG